MVKTQSYSDEGDYSHEIFLLVVQKFKLPIFPKGGGGGGIERFLCLCDDLISISEKGLAGVGDLDRDGVLPAFSVK